MHARVPRISLPMWKVVQTILEDSALKKCVKKMTVYEHRALVNLFHIAYFKAQKGHTFTNFKNMLELGKLHS